MTKQIKTKSSVVHLRVDVVPFPHFLLLESLHHVEHALHHRRHRDEVQGLGPAQGEQQLVSI